jgi:hypothetical protein
MFNNLRNRLRQIVCFVTGGFSHRLLMQRDKARVYQRCVCGYETPGWSMRTMPPPKFYFTEDE